MTAAARAVARPRSLCICLSFRGGTSSELVVHPDEGAGVEGLDTVALEGRRGEADLDLVLPGQADTEPGGLCRAELHVVHVVVQPGMVGEGEGGNALQGGQGAFERVTYTDRRRDPAVRG